MQLLSSAIMLAVLLAASAAPGRAQSWQRVQAWEGSGIRTTETFAIGGGQWQVAWTGQMSSGVGALAIYVYRDSGELVGIAANQSNEPLMSGQSIQRGAGSYYLTINSFGGPWQVTVDEFRE